MKIVWLTWKDLDNPLSGGAEVVNEELAMRLARAGHHVTFLTSGFAGAPAATHRHGFTIIRTGSRFSTYLTTAKYFMQHRASLQPDLVIDECNTMPFFAAWYTRTPTVMMFHMLCRGIWFYEFPLPLAAIGYVAEPIYLRLLKRRQTIITISRSTKQDLLRHGFQAQDIKIIAEGSRLAPITSLSSQAKFPAPTMLSLGSVRPMKRTLHQVKAFEIAKRTIPTLQLKLAGDASGAYGARVLRYVAASPYASDIEVLGSVSESKKLELMRGAHVITVTSVKEGWGLIVTEAASQGTPAVVYNVDGLRDAVRHDETGLIAPRNTPAGLASSIVELLSDDGRYASLCRTAWEWSRELTFDQSYADFTKALDIK